MRIIVMAIASAIAHASAHAPYQTSYVVSTLHVDGTITERIIGQ